MSVFSCLCTFLLVNQRLHAQLYGRCVSEITDCSRNRRNHKNHAAQWECYAENTCAASYRQRADNPDNSKTVINVPSIPPRNDAPRPHFMLFTPICPSLLHHDSTCALYSQRKLYALNCFLALTYRSACSKMYTSWIEVHPTIVARVPICGQHGRREREGCRRRISAISGLGIREIPV